MCFLSQTPEVLFEFIWQRLQGIHPRIPEWRFTLTEKVVAATIALPGARNRWWQSFERMIPKLNRRENWTLLGSVFGCALPPLIESPDDGVPRFPKGCQTPEELAQWLLKNHSNRIPAIREEWAEEPPAHSWEWDRSTVWTQVQHIIADCLSLDLDQITPESRMHEDLGMD